jgi:RHS repeat-associated protein
MNGKSAPDSIIERSKVPNTGFSGAGINVRVKRTSIPLLLGIGILGALASLSANAQSVTLSGPGESLYGQSVTFTANITEITSGTIQLIVDGGTLISQGFSESPVTFTTSTLTVGTHSVYAQIPSGPSSNSVSITVSGSMPTITWPTPTAITYGTPLSATQLDATLSVAGSCGPYTLPSGTGVQSGTVLAAGTYTLSVTCTPTNTTDYTTPPPSTVSLTVNPATVTVTANATRIFDVPNPPFQPTCSGFVNGDTSAVISGAPGMTTTATQSSPLATYPITVTAGTLAAANYSFSYVNGILNVVQSAIAPSSAGNMSTVVGNGILGGSGDGGPATNAELGWPYGVAFDIYGNLYIADVVNARVREVNAVTGKITTVAGTGTRGYDGDGGWATNAELNYPMAVAFDSLGDLFIGDNTNNRIRMVAGPTPPNGYIAGYIYTVAGGGSGCSQQTDTLGDGCPASNAELNDPWGIALDSSGNLYIADTADSRVRMVAGSTANGYTAGYIYTVAGTGTPGYSGDHGLATSAKLNYPSSIAFDSFGNLIIADSDNNRIRKVTAPISTGIITTFAGTGVSGYSGDNDPATSAEMFWPSGVAVDSSGNVYILEGRTSGSVNPNNCGLRKVIASGSLAGNIYTVAGNGVCGYSGDGALATSAEMNNGYADAIGIDPLGNLYFADEANFRIRAVGYTNVLTPTIVWPVPAAIQVGAALSATQLDAVTDVPSNCIYSTSGGTVLQVGTVLPLGAYALSVTCTPTGTTAYSPGTATNSLIVNQVPAIAWDTPAAITYGTALSGTQLDATSPVSGTFVYTPAVGTVQTAGTQTLSVTFTPTNSTAYATTTITVAQTILKATPTITWPSPAPFASGTALSTLQLDAALSVAGTPTYFPASGTVLTEEGPYTLTVAFVPQDTNDYNPVSQSVTVFVQSATETSWDSGTVTLTVISNPAATATVNYGSASTPSSIAEALQAASNSQVTVSAVDDTLYIKAAGTTGTVSNYGYSISAQNANTTAFPIPSFAADPPSGSLEGGDAQNTPGATVYTFQVPSPNYGGTGYDGVGNMVNSYDSVMGTWGFSYDTLNRLAGASDNQSGNPSSNYCWGYDAFGNRTIQAGSSAPFSPGSPTCTPATGASLASTWANYSTNNNRIVNTSQATGGISYDAAGNVLNDGVNQYLYDGDGRLCAVASTPIPGTTTMTGYIYDADGTRIAKGSITSWSCNPGSNGFTTINDYVIGPSGEQVTEMGMDSNNSGSTGMVWQHTNVWAGSKLLATYDNDGLHFYLNDPLGTRRVQTDSAGVIEQTCQSQPFGDGLNCITLPNSNNTTYVGSLTTPTEHHFTGKERDAESGNDYFWARYYASSMGRFMSPDWSAKQDPVPYARLDNPQTLNLYAYLRNNPLAGVDADGHCPPGQDCSQVKVTSEQKDPSTGKPTSPQIVQNEKQPDGTTRSGARAIVTDTITVGGKALPDKTLVSESNENTLTVNGKKIDAQTAQSPPTPSTDGKVGDVFGPLKSTTEPGSSQRFADALSGNAVTMTGKQTLTFDIPGGATCSATIGRTLTNGSGGSTYTYTTTSGPTVTQAQPQQ